MGKVYIEEQNLIDIANSIRKKGQHTENMKPREMAEKIDAIENTAANDNGIHLVSTIEERDALKAKEGDVCLVYNFTISKWTENTQTASIQFPQTVILPEAFTSTIYGQLRSVDTANGYLDGMIDGSQTRFRIDGYMNDGSFNIQYTSSDGITYTRTTFNGMSFDPETGEEISLISGDVLILPQTCYVELMEGSFDILGYFMQGATTLFDGNYVYTNAIWEYMNVGANVTADDILLNKKAYTNNGFVTGTIDPTMKLDINIYAGTTEPTITPLLDKALYLQMAEDTTLTINKNLPILTMPKNYNSNIVTPLPYSISTNQNYQIDGDYIYYVEGDYRGSSLVKQNILTGAKSTITTLGTNGSPYKMHFVKHGDYIYYPVYNQGIYKINIETKTKTLLSGMISPPTGSYTYSPDNTFLLYYPLKNQLQVYSPGGQNYKKLFNAYDLTTNTWVEGALIDWPLSKNPYRAVLISDEEVVYCYNSLGKFNMTTKEFTNLSVPGIITTIAFDKESGTIYAFETNSGGTLMAQTVDNQYIGAMKPIDAPVYSGQTIFWHGDSLYITAQKGTPVKMTNIQFFHKQRITANHLEIQCGDATDTEFKINNSNQLAIADVSYVQTVNSQATDKVQKIYRYNDNIWELIKDKTI